jgi:IS66 C-terminal element
MRGAFASKLTRFRRECAKVVATRHRPGSLLTTARLIGVDPLTWLTDLLERIVSGQTKNHQLHELLPWEWKAARAAQEMKAAA